MRGSHLAHLSHRTLPSLLEVLLSGAVLEGDTNSSLSVGRQMGIRPVFKMKIEVVIGQKGQRNSSYAGTSESSEKDGKKKKKK